ncbi:helicase-associated domain-containing protein [Micromonospora sp. NBC_00389]|uniref:hypothetical protein n=1 Tax=Micromonospora sp. NBC_00389 TaxID=2903586 RepID=UPI002E23767F
MAQTADRVWTLRDATLLTDLDAGRSLDQLRQFLADRATHELPNPVTTLLADVEARTGRLRNLGVVRLIECADPRHRPRRPIHLRLRLRRRVAAHRHRRRHPARWP